MHDEVKSSNNGVAFDEDLQRTHEAYLWIKDAFDEFERDHFKGAVERDGVTARRRARVASIELGKRMKVYRSVSNDVDAEKRRKRREAKAQT